MCDLHRNPLRRTQAANQLRHDKRLANVSRIYPGDNKCDVERLLRSTIGRNTRERPAVGGLVSDFEVMEYRVEDPNPICVVGAGRRLEDLLMPFARLPQADLPEPGWACGTARQSNRLVQ